MKVIVIIPARGGSKGIPRKNLRPLAGKPMIYYSIKAALGADCVQKVVVTTDDSEIALFSTRFGAEVIMRPENLGQDTTTLDPVILNAYKKAKEMWDIRYDIIITIQPTSPLVRSKDIDLAIKKFELPEIDTVISVVDDKHLRWTIMSGEPVPVYSQRVNRQQLPSSFKETGAIIACRSTQLKRGTRIGQNIALHEMEYSRSFDIDSIADLYLCESILNQKRIVFTVVGNKNKGLGHAYRTVMLAHELVRHEILFVCEEQDYLARDYILNHNYQVKVAKKGLLLDAVLSLSPDMVINDILDTDLPYIESLLKDKIKVVNFEDLGNGHTKAGLVFNALYPDQIPRNHVFTGVKYFCLRDEFLYGPSVEPHKLDVKNVLITFGGVDEASLALRVLQVIAPLCVENNVAINIVTGPGYQFSDDLKKVISMIANELIEHVTVTARITDFMAVADLAITSGGRTVFELASMQVPTLVICQNHREITHTFASSENGIVNLGVHEVVEDERILKTFNKLLTDQDLRQTMRARMAKMDLTHGKERVIKKICELLERE